MMKLLLYTTCNYRLGLLLGLLWITPLTAALDQLVLQPAADHDPYAHNLESTRANANTIFNAVHSAARQWGSSVHHNGLSLIPVTVPEGTLLYHGDGDKRVPDKPEWLAFEIEHAEHFAARNASEEPAHIDVGRPGSLPGYLHIYQANRPLRLLYFDGMSAGTASYLGPTDMQLMMFLNTTWERCCSKISDYGRVMCDKASEWGVEGFVRMEAGFEVIKCDFSDGLDLVATNLRPNHEIPEGQNEGWIFGWVRAMAQRYNGIDAHRIIVDFSSMIHAGFYPTNLTNPDPAFAHLPRLVSADPEQLRRIHSDARAIWSRNNSQLIVDWQGAVDMIVKRFGDRLQYLATQPTHALFRGEINVMLNTFIDYTSFSEQESINSCARHYLLSTKSFTEQDKLIHAAVQTVTHKICTTLFKVRADILTQEYGHGAKLVDTSKGVKLVQDLIEWLDWSEWKICRPSCPYDRVCYITVVPWGTTSLHYDPRCLNSNEIEDVGASSDYYWFPEGFSWVPK